MEQTKDELAVTEVALKDMKKDELIALVERHRRTDQFFEEQLKNKDKIISQIQEHSSNLQNEAERYVEHVENQALTYKARMDEKILGLLQIVQGAMTMLISDKAEPKKEKEEK